MKHSLNIRLSKPQENNVLKCTNIFIREKLLKLIFGRLHGLTIIIPGSSIDKIAITDNSGGD